MAEKTLRSLSVTLSPTAKAKRVHPNASLDSAFAGMESSHEVALVFTKESGSLLGITSPSHAIFRHRKAGTTKVRSCVIQPPRITRDTPVSDIAHMMLATGMYELPVLSETGMLEGIVEAEGLIEAITKHKDLLKQASQALETEEAVLLSSEATAKEAYNLMRDKKASRILLTDKSSNVEGVLTRRDLQSHILKPSSRQRFRSGPSRSGKARNFVFGTEKESNLSFLALAVATTNVRTAPAKSLAYELFLALAKGKEPSLVLVDAKGRPTGIVSVRSALRAIISLKQTSSIPVIIRNQARLFQRDVDHVKDLLDSFAEKYAKRKNMVRLEAGIDKQKNTAGRPTAFLVTLQALCLPGGESTNAKNTDRDLLVAVRGALKKMEAQLAS